MGLDPMHISVNPRTVDLLRKPSRWHVLFANTSSVFALPHEDAFLCMIFLRILTPCGVLLKLCLLDPLLRHLYSRAPAACDKQGRRGKIPARVHGPFLGSRPS